MQNLTFLRLRLVDAFRVGALVAVLAACASHGVAPGSDCSESRVRSIVEDLLESVNDGTIGQKVDQFVEPAGSFAWFSVSGPGERIDPEARDRSTLGGYLSARSATGEQMTLVSFKSSHEPNRNIANFEFRIRRTAQDIVGEPIVDGKGAVDCATERIIVWSVGAPTDT